LARVTASRVAGFGTSIFTRWSALAERTGALNLGQGFPDEDGPAELLEAAVAAIRAGRNQYAPLAGVPALRESIAAHQARFYGLAVDPEQGVQVTFGATEAIAAALLGLLERGDEVVLIDPAYDAYEAAVAMAGGVRRSVALRPPDWALDPDALRAAIGPRTRALILNTPHNPTGKVFSRAELEEIAAACREHDLVAIADEVYEHLVFEGEHVPLATLEGMAERTLTVSSLGKTFSCTGWKVGWATGPPELVAAVAAAKQHLTFAGATPFQHAGAVALALADDWYAAFAAGLRERRDRLCAGLSAAGLEALVPAGTYFAMALVDGDGAEFCRELPERCGVVAIPSGAFYADPETGRRLVRFAFCKRPEVIDEAARRLAAGLGSPRLSRRSGGRGCRRAARRARRGSARGRTAGRGARPGCRRASARAGGCAPRRAGGGRSRGRRGPTAPTRRGRTACRGRRGRSARAPRSWGTWSRSWWRPSRPSGRRASRRGALPGTSERRRPAGTRSAPPAPPAGRRGRWPAGAWRAGGRRRPARRAGSPRSAARPAGTSGWRARHRAGPPPP
jgi:N-succinyldiaminopimelate aminotransferase